MVRRVLAGALGVLVVLLALVAWVVVPAGRDLVAARNTLQGSVGSLTVDRVKAARADLDHAQGRLSGFPARVLGVIPLLGANVDAMGAVGRTMIPVLDAAALVGRAVEGLGAGGLLHDGRIDPASVEGLRGPIDALIGALQAAEQPLRDQRSGSLAPPVWSALDDLIRQARALRERTERFRDVLDVIPGLLGADGPRTYLVMLLNNAELRGGGGVLSGVGSIRIGDGRLTLGRLYPIDDLQRLPPRPVPAPPDYLRRFGRYKANTTLWLNTTFSPSFPDDALVASRLFRKVTGVRTDGAIAIDPRGLAALLPPDVPIAVPGTDRALTPAEFPAYVYSDAYSEFSSQRRRQLALLGLGRRAFRAFLGGGLADRDRLAAVGAALAGGHLRIVSFAQDEEAVLEGVGADGELPASPNDSMLVTVQNFGGGRPLAGTKLDYWVERSVTHTCDLPDGGRAACATQVTLRNVAPEGLTRYVAGVPYGMLRSYVEVYVPAAATLGPVSVNGRTANLVDEVQGDRRSVAVYVEVPRSATGRVEVRYELPSAEHYGLVATPQPLGRDATFRLVLRLPRRWVVSGPGHESGDRWVYQGAFDGTVSVSTGDDERTGLSGLWANLVDLWHRPLL